MDPRVQYARTSDGVNIALWSLGEGQPLLFMPSMPVSHIESEWQIPEWRAWYETLAEHMRLIRYDGRGMGLSDRRAIDYSLDTLLLDMDAVVDRLKLERFAIFAAYHSGPAAIAYAAKHPDRVSHLLLWCSFASAAEMQSPVVAATRSLLRQDWDVYTQTAARVLLGWDAGDEAHRFARLIKEANTPDGMMALLDAASGFDVTDQLELVKAPTLVMHRRSVRFVTLDMARGLAGRIPDARLAVFEGESMAPYVGDLDAVTNAMFEFMGQARSERRAPGTSLRTILFTDIEGHTSIMQRLGDERGRQVLRDHERIIRDALREYGGSEIKTMGDGFLASFSSAQRALQSAIALQKAFRTYNAGGDVQVMVRVGLNAGEPIAEQGDLFGTAVIMASRTAAQARGGEILATDVVRQLATGRGFDFGDRGAFALRGFEDPVRLFEVKWRD
jgi:class 3 adenylate cyclase